jgi:predicted DNA-binding protein (MmcQ/YjbR family)
MTTKKTKPTPQMKKAADSLRKCALTYPGAHEDSPWGHAAFKIGKKVFLFLSVDGDGLSAGVKLDRSRFEALELPFTEPTHYGLGKHGWVTSIFKPKDKIPMGFLEQWIDESYRLIAPKKLVKQLDEGAPAKSKIKSPKAKPRPRKKVAKKKP